MRPTEYPKIVKYKYSQSESNSIFSLLIRSVIADSATALCEVFPTAATKQLHCEAKLWGAELPHNEQRSKEHKCVVALT